MGTVRGVCPAVLVAHLGGCWWVAWCDTPECDTPYIPCCASPLRWFYGVDTVINGVMRACVCAGQSLISDLRLRLCWSERCEAATSVVHVVQRVAVTASRRSSGPGSGARFERPSAVPRTRSRRFPYREVRVSKKALRKGTAAASGVQAGRERTTKRFIRMPIGPFVAALAR